MCDENIRSPTVEANFREFSRLSNDLNVFFHRQFGKCTPKANHTGCIKVGVATALVFSPRGPARLAVMETVLVHQGYLFGASVVKAGGTFAKILSFCGVPFATKLSSPPAPPCQLKNATVVSVFLPNFEVFRCPTETPPIPGRQARLCKRLSTTSPEITCGRSQSLVDSTSATWPWVKSQIAPPVNIPIPTKIR